MARGGLPEAPLWYKDAVFYELRLRSFFDGNDDGVGDLRGTARKLDYLADLGVTALWLLPFYPSPMRDDGYDIADYRAVHPQVGTLAELRRLLRGAHERGMRVVTELVLNHTSDRHPWFVRARRSPPGSVWRRFYVWSDDPRRFAEARVIFCDSESSNWTWDPVAGAYYWHRFYSHQPDLNYDEPRVQAEILKVVDFWFGMGVDGLRLDAVPYLFEREGTTCENLPEGHAFLRRLRAHIDARYPHRMLLAEANQWPEDAAAYFGEGDEAHMAFHFPLMPRLFMALRMEDRFPIVDILAQTPTPPESCQWAVFLRNHDELTLEMVTDEERDYMYRAYARDGQARLNLGIRRRLAPLLGNDRKKIELMNALLFSLPGSPVIYYGDEIGMGDNIYLGDRDGVRTPLQWSADRNAGFSQANPQRLLLPVITDPEYHYQAVNIAAQQGNPHSLLWWMKRLIALRRRHAAFGRGALRMLQPRNPRILAFLRCHEGETLLVVCNLSRFVQHVELDLAEFRGQRLVELFGRGRFPVVRESPYPLSLGPHAFFWFAIEKEQVDASDDSAAPGLQIELSLVEALGPGGSTVLAPALSRFMRRQRWFAGKARVIRACRIAAADELPTWDGRLLLVAVDFLYGGSETYLLPVLAIPDGPASERAHAETTIAVLTSTGPPGSSPMRLVEASGDPALGVALLACVARRATSGQVVGHRSGGAEVTPPSAAARLLTWPEQEQTNSSLVVGREVIVKLTRRVEEGLHPESEVGELLAGCEFPHAPRLVGWIERRGDDGSSTQLAVVHRFVENQGDAWHYAHNWLGRFFDRALAQPGALSRRQRLAPRLGPWVPTEPPSEVEREWLGEFLDAAERMGQRTAQLHACLASAPADPAFRPEPYTAASRRSLYQSMRSLAGRVFQRLREALESMPEDCREDGSRVLALEREVLRQLRQILERSDLGMRIRCHGDYHLGQVLHTGRDFVIVDFEGEPTRPLAERRIKMSPLSDVAGMLRSFAYVAEVALLGHSGGGQSRAQDLPALEPWARWWRHWASSVFLGAYRQAVAPARLLPSDPDGGWLLRILWLHKSVYELGYELAHRPAWTRVPLRAILSFFVDEPT